MSSWLHLLEWQDLSEIQSSWLGTFWFLVENCRITSLDFFLRKTLLKTCSCKFCFITSCNLILIFFVGETLPRSVFQLITLLLHQSKMESQKVRFKGWKKLEIKEMFNYSLCHFNNQSIFHSARFLFIVTRIVMI